MRKVAKTPPATKFLAYAYAEKSRKVGMLKKEVDSLAKAIELVRDHFPKMMRDCLQYAPRDPIRVAVVIDRNCNAKLYERKPFSAVPTAKEIEAEFKAHGSCMFSSGVYVGDLYIAHGTGWVSIAQPPEPETKWKCWCGETVSSKNAMRCPECHAMGCENCVTDEGCPECQKD